MEQKTAETSSPSISLPKGGGAVKGIGETFQPNLFSGTGNFNIPIFTSSGREGFGPQLSLQYSTGNGNSIFGLGWQLTIPRITRKTEKGLPLYDTNDVFVMSGAEDLVPKFKNNSQETDIEIIPSGNGQNLIKYRVTRFLPRTEGLFARIESWEELELKNTSEDSDPTHLDVNFYKDHNIVNYFWRVTTKENVTSIYGRTPAARVSNPDSDPQKTNKVFEWLLEETFDSKGNHISYEYACDDDQLTTNSLSEQNRNYSQIYPRRIFYGNVPDQLTDFNNNQFTSGVKRKGTDHRNPFKTIDRRYLFEVVFEYGNWKSPFNNSNKLDYQDPGTTQEKFDNKVPVRPDPFSSFRSGFELRTLRQCDHILMIHHFKELEGQNQAPMLVKSTDLYYEQSSGTKVSLLTSATITGYSKNDNDDYHSESMPPVEFKYSEFKPNEQHFQPVKAKDNNLPAVSLADPNTSLVDILGNGLQDILQTTPAGFQYWRNQGDAEFDRPHLLHESPAGLMLADSGVHFADMGGDGLADLIVNKGAVQGFFELQAEHEVAGQLKAGWSPQSFTHYDDQPSINFSDPNIRMLDLTGDGLTDLLITTDREFIWYQSKGEQGYSAQKHVPKLDGLKDIYFNDQSRVRITDMTGDGLNDIVLMHNGSIKYWPNMGYGKFGKPITMSTSDEQGTLLPANFNPQRLFLADLDGSGTSDLVYVDFNQVHFWFNQSGNSWSEKQTISGTPVTVDTASLSFTDFFGTGTTSLLWSYDYGTFADGHYKVLDFCGKKKPYLLTEMDNNLGATTRVRYASSTKFYLDDIKQGDFWATPLPFPVQVVEKTESIDHISKTKLVTCYKYHHGYYDGREREFRGFGRVDQIDTESFDSFKQDDLHDAEFINNSESHHVPPVETRTWFHTGAYYEDRDIQEHYQSEYFAGIEKLALNQRPTDPLAFDMGDHEFDINNSPITEAFRALRGSTLRTEIYAHDDSADKNFPYQVTESRYRIESKQEQGTNPHAVFLNTSKETISYHYERKHKGQNLIDPRIQHQMVLDTDDLGNILKSAEIAYKRRQTSHTEQEKDLISISHQDYCQPRTDLIDFRHSTPVSSQQFELTGMTRNVNASYSITNLNNALLNAQEIAFEDKPTQGKIQNRKLSQQITLFWKDDLTGSAPIGNIGFHGLAYEAYTLALTPSLRQSIYGNNQLTPAMGKEGGYKTKSNNQWLDSNSGDWWIPSGKQTFDPTQFYLPIEAINPFGDKTEIQYDPYSLFPASIVDPLDNKQEGIIDYRVLQPYLTRDLNGNHTEVAFDTLGLVVGTAIMGKAGRNSTQSLLGIDNNAISQMRSNTEADSLQGFKADLKIADVQKYMDNPDGTQSAYSAHEIRQSLNKASTRILYDLHRYQNEGKPTRGCVISREIHDKIAVNTESPLQLAYTYPDGFGREIQQKVQAEPENPNNQPIKRCWITSGWTIFNNKGKPVQQYEPFFSDSQDFEPNKQIGVTSTIFYDPLQRAICTLHPNHSYEKVLFDPWQQTSWDSNDTVLLEPQNDPDVKGYVEKYIASLGNFKTWYQQLIPDPTNLPSPLNRQQQAAEQSKLHADTPTIAHLNTQGTTFLTIADNKTEKLETRVEIDIQGHDLSITDPRGIKAFTHSFDMAGRKLQIDSVDAGKKHIFLAVDEQQLYHWDENKNRVNTVYDKLRRPSKILVEKSGGSPLLTEKLIYGEARPQAEISNSRGMLWKHYDGAGLAITDKVDFKGNILTAQRQLLADGKVTEVNWPIDGAGLFDEAAAKNLLQNNTQLNTPAYKVSTQYDALNRITKNQLPDDTQQTPTYNQASLLETVTVKHPNKNPDTYVSNIDYNAKGQRKLIKYGNGVITKYEYEQDTFRLQSITTERISSNPKKLQELSYIYDPVGNITSIRDDAHPKIFNLNQQVDPESKYQYDAIYRLIEASGREHESMTACHYQTNGKKHTEFIQLSQPTTNAQALINYQEKYQYDKSGNIERIEHKNKLRTTIRNQTYASQSNRIATSKAGCSNENANIPHDANGNITHLPHLSHLSQLPNMSDLPNMGWDYKNQLIEVQLNQGANPNKAYYQYDSQGQRIRKTIVKNNDTTERIYLGDYEIYTETTGTTVKKQRDTVHVSDDQNRIALSELEKDLANPILITNKVIRFQLNNHLGSSSLELDPSGDMISYEEYYPYGGSAYMAGRTQAETSLKRYRYSGKERDDETGMYYYGARYYAPWMGRWMSADQLLTTNNLYQSFINNPIKFIDPTGNKDEHHNEIHVPTSPSKSISTLESESARRKRLGLPPVSGKRISKKNVVNSLTYVGVISGAIPYIGDYVSLATSIAIFSIDPSVDTAIDVPLDAIGAILPVVIALGTARRVTSGSKYLKLSDDVISFQHGTDKADGIMSRGFDVSKNKGQPDYDLSSGAYFTDDPHVAFEYGKKRTKRSKSGDFDIVDVDIKGSDLGRIVDISPNGKHRKQWDEYLNKEDLIHKKTPSQILTSPGGINARSAVFDSFLKKYDLEAAQTVISDIDQSVWLGGIGKGHGALQIAIKDPAVANKLYNQIVTTIPK